MSIGLNIISNTNTNRHCLLGFTPLVYWETWGWVSDIILDAYPHFFAGHFPPNLALRPSWSGGFFFVFFLGIKSLFKSSSEKFYITSALLAYAAAVTPRATTIPPKKKGSPKRPKYDLFVRVKNIKSHTLYKVVVLFLSSKSLPTTDYGLQYFVVRCSSATRCGTYHQYRDHRDQLKVLYNFS